MVYRPFLFQLSLFTFPRKGTETVLSLDNDGQVGQSLFTFPRKGTETGQGVVVQNVCVSIIIYISP